MKTLTALAAALRAGTSTSVALTEACLANIADERGEGKHAFVKVYAESALHAARMSDLARARGVVRSKLEGLPISIKDLFDVAGEVTRAGSYFLTTRYPPRRMRRRLPGCVRRAW